MHLFNVDPDSANLDVLDVTQRALILVSKMGSLVVTLVVLLTFECLRAELAIKSKGRCR